MAKFFNFLIFWTHGQFPLIHGQILIEPPGGLKVTGSDTLKGLEKRNWRTSNHSSSFPMGLKKTCMSDFTWIHVMVILFYVFFSKNMKWNFIARGYSVFQINLWRTIAFFRQKILKTAISIAKSKKLWNVLSCASNDRILCLISMKMCGINI